MSDHTPPAVQQHQQPFGMAAYTGANAGSVEIESQRAIAEAQGQLVLAKKFPRSVTAAITELMDACKSPDFVATAFYSVPNRGSGPSIRFAEEVARCYGNFEYGHREIGRSADSSEVEVFAWDKEKNNRSVRQITVKHVLDTKNGPKKLIDQADIDNKIANVASKQMRGRILALMPKHMVAAGIAECKRTLAGGNEKPMRDRIIAMSAAFGKFGVSVKHLDAHLGHGIDDTTVDELADLMGIYNAIKGGAKASEYFNLNADADEATASTAAAITRRATAGASKASAETAAPAAPGVTKSKAAPAASAAPAPSAAKQNSKPAESVSNEPKSATAESTDKQAAAETPPPADPAGDDDVF